MNNAANKWREETPGASGWTHSARPYAPNKYLMFSADTHIVEPNDLWARDLPDDIAKWLPRVQIDEQGRRWEVLGGLGKHRAIMQDDEGDDEDKERSAASRSAEGIVRDMDRDGIDFQLAFANKGMMLFSVPDVSAMYAVTGLINDWFVETFSSVKDRVLPMAMVPTADVDMTLKELDRIGKMGFFRGIMFPTKPIFGASSQSHPNYNLPVYDPVWARVQEMDLTITYHISTGSSPKTARGNGGAIINYAAHAMPSAVEPVVSMCSSGLFDRFPKLRFATIEAGIGWVPFILDCMDEAHKKHHMWAKPRLAKLPSEYYYEHGFSSFGEDTSGLMTIDPRFDDSPYKRLENKFMWANDYPHHEGTWPHSAAAIEREMGRLTEQQRVKLLGENAVRCFKIQDLVAKRQAAQHKN